eukprot:15435300-Alexandrium_andersonii.AAC.1
MADGPRENPTPTSRASLRLVARSRRGSSGFACASSIGCGAAVPQLSPNVSARRAIRKCVVDAPKTCPR